MWIIVADRLRRYFTFVPTQHLLLVSIMGRVKSRKIQDTEREMSIAKAMQAYTSGKYPTLQQAAESQGLPHTILYGRL